MTNQRKLLDMYAQAQKEICDLKQRMNAALALLRIVRAKGYFAKELEGKI